MAPPPTSEWGLDPLFWVNVKVAVCEIVGPDAVVTDAEGGHGAVRLYRGRPFRRCELMGHVVSLYARDTKTLFVLDDGTGTIECVVWMKSEGDNGGGVDGGVSVDDFGIDLNALRLGALVRARAHHGVRGEQADHGPDASGVRGRERGAVVLVRPRAMRSGDRRGRAAARGRRRMKGRFRVRCSRQ
jgi:hypothetical protein